MKNILEGTRIYLVGAIESCEDAGEGWREIVSKELEKMGVTVFNPLKKPFQDNIENDMDEGLSFQDQMKRHRENGEWDELSQKMRKIRIYDLKLVDISDAIFVYIDENFKTCGSWEEVFVANSMKKPIFFVYKQGKKSIPTWIYGTLPHQYMHESLDDALKMLKGIDEGSVKIDSDRWKLLRKEYR